MGQFRPIIFFLLRFFGAYFILLIMYNLYLNPFSKDNVIDPYTEFIGNQTAYFMNQIDGNTKSMLDDRFPIVNIKHKGKIISHVNEGCNAVSIIIIFIAFMIGFYHKFKPTLLFTLLGIIAIVLFNWVRIGMINYVIYYLPNYGEIAHDYILPLILYGFVFLLWIVWIRFFILKRAV